ncbi:MAG: hypothetical protein MMC33_009667 [Icmadophila ericetorum]|nr:hypothetical protein [Icmadophila ericetorum]
MFQGYRLEKDGHIHHGIGYLGLLGNTLVITYSVYFFELAGLETSQSFNLGVGVLAVGFIVTQVFYIATAVGIPYALNPDAGNFRGKVAFVFLATAIPSLIWGFLALPEMKGRTFEELDLMFKKKIPTA